MATAVFRATPAFGVGASLQAWPEEQVVEARSVGSSVASGTVAADGTVTFAGLDQGRRYAAGTSSSGPFIRFTTEAAPAVTPAGDLTLASLSVGSVILPPPPVTSLVAGVAPIPNPIPNGFEVYYIADTLAGIRWHMRYVNAGGGQWVCIGGQPLVSAVDAIETMPAGTGYTTLATAGPSLTPPLTGDFDVRIEATPYNSGAGIANARVSYQIGSAAAQDADAAMCTLTTIDTWISVSRTRRKTLVAGDALSMRYRLLAGTGQFGFRFMSLMPVRIPA